MKIPKFRIENNRAEALKFSALEFTYWAAMSVGSFLTVFLQSIGFTASQVGIVNAANSAVGIVSGPVWGMLSDKIRSVKKTMVACIFSTLVLQLFIPASTSISVAGIPLIMLYMPVVVFFSNPSMLLLDSWAIQSSHKHRFTYSSVRSMGSLSWAIAGIVVSLILRTGGFGVRNTFYVSSFMYLPVAVIAVLTTNTMADTGKTGAMSFREMRLGSLFKNYYFTAYLIYTFVLNFAFISGYSFYSYLIRDIGADITQMGIINGINAMVQFSVLLFIRPIQRRFPLHIILIAGNLLTGIQHFLFGTATSNFSQMMLFTVIQGFGSGFMIASGAKYIYSLAPRHLKATAQTVCGAANSIAGIFGNMLGGVVIDRFGVKSFYVVISIWIFISVTLFGLSFVFGRKVLKLEVPSDPALS